MVLLCIYRSQEKLCDLQVPGKRENGRPSLKMIERLKTLKEGCSNNIGVHNRRVLSTSEVRPDIKNVAQVSGKSSPRGDVPPSMHKASQLMKSEFNPKFCFMEMQCPVHPTNFQATRLFSWGPLESLNSLLVLHRASHPSAPRPQQCICVVTCFLLSLPT